MHPEDQVLVAIINHPRDLRLAQEEHWYRIPVDSVPKGLHADYIAFYCGSAFEDKKWAIHYYAKNEGHELARRKDLIPDEADHERSDHMYYRIQLGSLIELERPIVSLRWRRISFFHTTWDRFTTATEINDLFIKGETYVDRVFYTLHDAEDVSGDQYSVEDDAG